MKQINTQGIVLTRTDYGEADRIITFLTPNHGKVRVYARGVRKTKSKLAGGIELFSVSDISFIIGRSDLDTLTSTRLVRHYGHIVKDLERTNAGYEFISMLNKATEDEPEEAYFDLLLAAFGGLDDFSLDLALVRLWVRAQLLKLSGHTPDLHTDADGEKLRSGGVYDFDFNAMRFRPSPHGDFSADHIKFLRLCFGRSEPKVLQKIKGLDGLVSACQPLLQTMLQTYVRT